jgi:hypothetical protein
MCRSCLKTTPGLRPRRCFEFLQRQNPGRFQDGQVRTLQRRVKVWRATEGPAREVFFAQQHPPGRLGASDFTHMEELGVTIQGQSFPHLIYHLRSDVLELGGSDGVLFRELREPE